MGKHQLYAACTLNRKFLKIQLNIVRATYPKRKFNLILKQLNSHYLYIYIYYICWHLQKHSTADGSRSPRDPTKRVTVVEKPGQEKAHYTGKGRNKSGQSAKSSVSPFFSAIWRVTVINRVKVPPSNKCSWLFRKNCDRIYYESRECGTEIYNKLWIKNSVLKVVFRRRT